MESTRSKYAASSYDHSTQRAGKDSTVIHEKQCYFTIDSIFSATEPLILLRDDTIFELNKAAEEFFGSSRETIHQNIFFSHIHPDDQERVIALYDSSPDSDNMVFSYQCRIRDKDNTFKWIQVISIKFRLRMDTLFFNYLHDITPQIENDQKYHHLFDSTPDAIVEFDVINRRILSINTAMADRFNQRPENMIGNDFSIYLPQEIYEKRFSIAKSAVDEKQIMTIHDSRNDKDYKDLYIPISYKTGKKTVLVISEDITTHTHIKKDLLSSEQQFKEIFNASIDAYFIINPSDLTIVDANIEAKNRFGFSKMNFRESTINDILNSKIFSLDEKFDKQVINRILSGKMDKQEVALSTTKNGSIWYEIITKSVEIHGENKLLMIARDISNRKNIENNIITYSEDLEKKVAWKTRELNEMLSERELLLEEIHHRVKNNLQIITSLIDLQCESLNESEQCRFFETLKNRIYIMALLHEQLYKSKDFKYVHLGDYLQGIVENLRRSLLDQRKRISVTISKTRESIDMKKAISCGLIVNELVSNAMKHAFPDGKAGIINIDVSTTEEEYLIKIDDNGIGLPNALSFDQSPSLGLQLVHMLIQQLDGFITIDSKNGSKITIQFPK